MQGLIQITFTLLAVVVALLEGVFKRIGGLVWTMPPIQLCKEESVHTSLLT